MSENREEQQPDADPSERIELPADGATPGSDGEQPGASAGEARTEKADRGADDGPSPGCSGDVSTGPDLDDSFDRDGLVVIGAIFLLIGLAVALEFFWQ